MSRSDKLQVAVKLIKEVQESLNRKQSLCDCCGLMTYENKHEWKMEQALETALHRIRKTIEDLNKLDKMGD